MADLQDTNAATEEIYGPLLIVEYPVSDEMISKHWRSSSKRKEKFLHTYSIQNFLGTQCMKNTEIMALDVRPRRTLDWVTYC